MRRKRLIAARERSLARLPITGELLRGSLLERTIRNHARNCAKCASGEGHRLSVLTVSYGLYAESDWIDITGPQSIVQQPSKRKATTPLVQSEFIGQPRVGTATIQRSA